MFWELGLNITKLVVTSSEHDNTAINGVTIRLPHLKILEWNLLQCTIDIYSPGLQSLYVFNKNKTVQRKIRKHVISFSASTVNLHDSFSTLSYLYYFNTVVVADQPLLLIPKEKYQLKGVVEQ